jgi:hypothetical protein
MNRIELTGLLGSHPLGALASFGLLRTISQTDAGARLSFIERDDWIAVLDSVFGTEHELLAFLTEWGKARAPEVLAAFGDDDVRVVPSRFQGLVRAALSGDAQDLELASFLVALAADGAKDKSKGFVKPSPFYMASGQQSFLDTMKKIHAHVRRENLWPEALFGPWSYATAEWGAGWDPGTERMHALRFKAPTKDKTACVAGAVWLAFEALPLFPTFSSTGAVRTVGWVEHDRLDHFRWALPGVPIGLDALRVLLTADELRGKNGGNRTRKALREGIAAIYESTRHEFGQGYAVFRPARRLA